MFRNKFVFVCVFSIIRPAGILVLVSVNANDTQSATSRGAAADYNEAAKAGRRALNNGGSDRAESRR